MPDFNFHVVAAYDILVAPISKRDYLGRLSQEGALIRRSDRLRINSVERKTQCDACG
jgi:hypothetical protein